MTIGIIGLGLIGGSFARALKKYTSHTVFGYDISSEAEYKAICEKAVDGILNDSLLGKCDLLIVALYPKATAAYICEKAAFFKKNAVVMDCGGVKRFVCESVAPTATQYGFSFIAAHPMAGKEFSGFDKSEADLFRGASLIIVRQGEGAEPALEMIETLAIQIGFGTVKYTTPEEHDKMIAFTSQLAHVVSSAYVKSPSALNHKGFSAGSFKDLTRVAYLNEDMWTELFLENADYLSEEIGHIIQALQEYKDAVDRSDSETLRTLLKDGREKKLLSEGHENV